VRLFQGDFAQETVFNDDPLGTALQWQSEGAMRLHIVDLDGAEQGNPQNLEVVRSIASTVFIPIEVGGGIRSISAMERLLKAGADRVVLGTAAVSSPEVVQEAVRRFGEAVVVSVDARGGFVATHGWQEATEISVVDFARAMVKLGVRRFVYTNIERDGTMTEPDFAGLFQLIDATRFPVIASGGVCSLLQLKVLRKLGAEGAIIGRALYTGDINLSQALQAVGD
jgi:phosphoribosylformimino-5-aminoimidazole carboxamide ribotide isomerase